MMSVLCFKSDGTLAIVQIQVESKDQREIHEDIDTFISLQICSPIPEIFHFSVVFFTAFSISLAEGGSVLILRKKMGISGMSEGSFGVGLFSKLHSVLSPTPLIDL
jgi:hypothetical protein